MKEFVSRNIQLIIMLAAWIFAGMIATPVAMAVIVLSILILKRKDLFPEMIIGFIFILMLSDSRQPELEFAKKVKDIYLLLMTAFYLFDRKKFQFPNYYILPLLPFLTWAFAMTFRNPDFDLSFQKTLSYGLLYFIIPAYFIKSYRSAGPIFLKNFIMLVTLLLMMGLGLAIVNPDFVFLAGRYSSVLGNPNAMGIFGFLVIVLVVCSQMKFPELFTKNELITVYVVLGLSILLSGSRNALMCIVMFLAFKKFYKISYWYGFMTVIVAIMLYQVVFANLPDLLQMLGLAKALRADSLEGGSGRMIAWLFALKQLNADVGLFMLGRGMAFDEYLFYINMKPLSALGHQGGVHNTYLALWLNTGIIGLLLWLAAFFRLMFKAVTTSHVALPIMYSVMFSAFYEAWLMGSLNPFHIMFLFILTLITTENKDFAGQESLSESPVPPEENLLPDRTENELK